MSSWYRWQGDTLILQQSIQPRASRDEFAGIYCDHLKIRTTATPVDGAANARLVRFLAREFGVAQRAVELVRGGQGRSKAVAITQPEKLPPDLDLSASAR